MKFYKIFIGIFVVATIILVLLFFEQDNNIVVDRYFIDELMNEGYSGEGYKIAVIDTGLHEEYLHRLTVEEHIYYNATDDSNIITDKTSHGTWVTCIMFCINNDESVSGLIKDSNFVFIKVSDDLGRIKSTYVEEAIDFAIMQEVDVINLSIGTALDYPEVEKAIERVILDGIIVVAAFGDDFEMYPAKYEESYSVGVVGVHKNADVYIDSDVFEMKALENTFYDYDGEEKSSFASSVFSSIIVLLLEKYDLEKNELDYNKIEGMIR